MGLLEILRRLWDPISTPIALGAGGLATHLWQRYLRRMAVFRWSASHTRLAVAGTDPNMGRVDVLWNGTPVTNLQFCVIEFENESSQDFTSVEVKFWYADGTLFYGQGNLTGTTQFLPWAPRYGAVIDKLLATPADQHSADDIQYLITHREYTIPIFNRGAHFSLAFVVHPGTGQEPVLQTACEHLGVRFSQRPQRPMVLGVVQMHATWLGLLMGALVTLAFGMATHTRWWVPTVAFVLGAFGQLVGVGIVQAKRWVVRTIG